MADVRHGAILQFRMRFVPLLLAAVLVLCLMASRHENGENHGMSLKMLQVLFQNRTRMLSGFLTQNV